MVDLSSGVISTLLFIISIMVAGSCTYSIVRISECHNEGDYDSL
jgi:hypothetical protein